MRSLFLTLLLFCFHSIYSQNGNEKISITFENSSKIEIIKRVEELTNYRFYFIENWLDNSLISGQYNNATLTVLLNDIFKDTVINYYITPDNKIILTRSILIHDSLFEDLFESTKVEIAKVEKVTPLFHTKETSTNKTVTETVRIGKENKNSNLKKYTLSGYIKNSTTSRPIPNLALIVENKNINVITDSSGFYSIKLPPGVNFLKTKSIGIQDSRKKIIIYDNGIYSFKLKESTEILEEIVLQTDKDLNIKEAVTGISRIQVKEIKNIPLVLGVRDILKVATTLPGITTAGEGSSGFNVRGGKEDQNLILLDNGVLYNPVHFFGIFSAINPFTTGDVNIYKSSIPAEYGGRLSSVFDIITKKGNDQTLSGEVSVGPVTSNITLEVPIIKDKSALLVGGRATYSDWILRSLDEESLKNSEASFYDIIAKYSHKINNNTSIEATGYYSKDIYSITSDSLFSYRNRLVTLKLDHTFNRKNKGSLILTNSEYKFNLDFDGDSNTNFSLGFKINESQLKLKMKYLYSKNHKFEYGISSKLYNINPGSIGPKGSESIVETLKIPKERALESALFISDNFKVNEKLLLNAGFRYSLYNIFGEATQRVFADGLPRNEGTVIDTLNFGKNEIIETYSAPEVRVSARYLFSPNFSVKASFNTSYQYIHILSNNTTISPTDTWKLSDLNIKPQRGNQYSLGFYKNLENNMYELSVEGFYKKFENILDYKVGADLLINESIETEVLQGEGKAYGAEFLIKKTKGKLNGWLGYTYSRSLFKLDSKFSEERINNGNYFPSNFDKPHDLSMVTNYKLTKRFSLSANFTYQTGRPVTIPVGNFIFNGSEQILYSDRNKFRIPDYYRLDIGFNIEGNHRIKKFAHSFWNISIYNVLGRNNPYSVFFVTENGKVKALQSSIFSIPIPTITFNFKF